MCVCVCVCVCVYAYVHACVHKHIYASIHFLSLILSLSLSSFFPSLSLSLSISVCPHKDLIWRGSFSLQTTPEVPVILSEVQSGVLHLLGLISGVRRGGKGIPISSLVPVIETDLLPRHLRLSKSCLRLSSPVHLGRIASSWAASQSRLLHQSV